MRATTIRHTFFSIYQLWVTPVTSALSIPSASMICLSRGLARDLLPVPARRLSSTAEAGTPGPSPLRNVHVEASPGVGSWVDFYARSCHVASMEHDLCFLFLDPLADWSVA